MQSKIFFVDKTGKKLEGNIIALFKGGNSNYIAYTDNEKTGDSLDLMVAKYEQHGKYNIIIPIDDDKEFEFAEKYLARELFEGDDEFED